MLLPCKQGKLFTGLFLNNDFIFIFEL